MKEHLSKNILIFLGLLLLDQGSKYIIRHSGGFYICNRGIAFGIEGVFLYLILFFLLVAVWKQRKNIRLFVVGNRSLVMDYQLAIVLIAAGGTSNLLDRIFFGCVIDFIDLRIWPASIANGSFAGWPVFNLADIFISIGALLLLFKIISNRKES